MTIAATTTALGKDYFVALETWLESITSWRAELPALGWEGGVDTRNRKDLCRSLFTTMRSSS